MDVISAQQTFFYVLVSVSGLALCFGIGASGVASVIGPSVGGGALSVRQAVALAAVMEFAGAYLAGGEVSDTIAHGIIDSRHFAAAPQLLIVVMLASLLAAGSWLLLASARAWPVAATHALVGALCGAAIAAFGADAINGLTIVEIGFAWLLAPLGGGLLALLLTMSCRRLIFNTAHPVAAARQWVPLYAFLVGWSVAAISAGSGLRHVGLPLSAAAGQLLAVGVGIAVAAAARRLIDSVDLADTLDRDHQHASVERLFLPQLALTGAALAFAHGSNEVANGIGPMATVLQILATGEVPVRSPVTSWGLLIGSIGIVAGLATFGPRVMTTVGKRITALTPSRAYCAAVATALITISASGLGLPLATTHVAVGAVIGVGIARGLGALDLRVVGGIIGSWLVTVPISALTSALIYRALQTIFF
ncbi:MAG TPA: inorganic phosphate transporter [Accumulibacter sp.]|nr:inorganic phosphate transporter [Accumulibacter sp.]